MKSFDFEEERFRQEIARLGAKRVLIQLPEGLKPEATRLAKIVEKAGALPIVSADPCYGACDLAIDAAEALGVDLIVHYGHSKQVKYEPIPTVYVEARAAVNVEDVVRKALPLMAKWHKIGLATTVQHVQTLDETREWLLRSGKIVAVGDSGRMGYPGQVVGCDYSNAKSIADEVEAFLFIGGGKFHALGVALSTSKPTVAADPFDNHVFRVDDEAAKIVKQRWASIEEAKGGRIFGVIVGLKVGQRRLEQALSVKDYLEKKEKSVVLLVSREITPESLIEFPSIDAYVNTACPRISIDDAPGFKKPLLTVNEALVVAGELSWEELCKKGLLEN
jgi:2-(3-amino-3-carboxypropyl)histidine synthase